MLMGGTRNGRLTLGYALGRAGEAPPPVWIVQGDEDVVAPKKAADELVERAG